MHAHLFGRFLKEHVRGIAGWAVAVAAITTMYTSFWPSMAENSELMEQYMSSMPGLGNALGWEDLSNPAGYVDATVLLLVPILVTVAAIGVGARAIAGDEEDGALELVMAYPVTRSSLLLQRFAAMVVYIAVLGGAMFAALLLLDPLLDLDIGPAHLGAACLSTVLIGLCFGSAAFAIGAVTGRRGAAIAGGAVLAVLGYLGNTFALGFTELEWMRFLSPFYYGFENQPLSEGLDPAFTLVLVAAPVVLALLSTGAFCRRDILV